MKFRNENQPRSRKRIYFFRSAAVFVSVVMGFLAVEAVLRLSGLGTILCPYSIFIPDPVLGYRGKPLASVTGPSVTGEFKVEFKHNREGFRDREWSRDKPPGVVRIICLGDSFTYGVGASADEAYPAALMRLLNQLPGFGGRVEVLNMGVPGYGTEAQALLFQEEGPVYQPDIVISTFLMNDIVDTSFGHAPFQISPEGFQLWNEEETLGHWGNWIYVHSRTLQILLKDMLRARRRKRVKERRPCGWAGIYQDNGCYEEDWRKVFGYYRQMKKTAEKLGAEFYILFIPDLNFQDPKQDYLEKRMRDFCEGANIGFISALSRFRSSGRKDLYWPEDEHCTATGYQLIAQEAAEVLLAARKPRRTQSRP